MHEISEKRKYKRIEKPYVTRFRVKPDNFQDIASTEWDMVAASDLGAGGTFFYTGKSLEIGTTLDLKIGFSKSSPFIKCVGRVTRAKRHLDTFIFGIAIEFTEIDEHIKAILNNTALFANPET